MNIPDLRSWEPKASDAKNVEDTKMLDTTAREPAETVSATNSLKEYIGKNTPFTKPGAKGRN